MQAVGKEISFPEGTFAYQGYHFTPHRRFKKWEKEISLRDLSRYLSSDRELGMSNYDDERSKVDYGIQDFYKASTDKNCDIFRCVETGKLYIPGDNELYIYTEPPQAAKAAEKPSLLGKLEVAKKTAVQSNTLPKEHKHRKPER